MGFAFTLYPEEHLTSFFSGYKDYWALGIFGATFVFLAFVLFIFVYALKFEVANKTRDLNIQIKRLEASERRNKALLLAMPDLFFIIDRAGTYVDGSTSRTELLKVPPEKLVGMNIRDIFTPDLAQKFMDSIAIVLANGGCRQFEYELEVPAGHRHFECRIVAMDSSRALYISRDVTKRYRHEKEIVRSLREKEVLLREVHHRVKNNLQVILSLVSLQADKFTNDEDRALMHETERRIQSMAQLYEMLYQTGDFLSINLKVYLSCIIDELVAAFHTVPDQILIDNRIDNLRVSLELALPLGLIVNELVSNSLKHAFTSTHTGSISVALLRDENAIILTVQDNGCGLPPDFDIDTATSLGFILVQSLVRQVVGSLSVLPKPGTGIKIVIPNERLRR